MDNVQLEVMTLEEKRCAALAAHDWMALANLFAEDYVHCHSTGMVQGKADMIEHVKRNPRTVEPRKPLIRIYGDLAILTGELINRSVERSGRASQIRMFATQVAHRIDGSWKFVSFQATRTDV